jgi:hypothetical protein
LQQGQPLRCGFGPGTANKNIFRKMLGLKEAVYEEKKQATLSDFFR